MGKLPNYEPLHPWYLQPYGKKTEFVTMLVSIILFAQIKVIKCTKVKLIIPFGCQRGHCQRLGRMGQIELN